MDKIQKDINDALETTRKWNPLLMIFAMPLYVFLLIWGSYFPKGVLRLASEAGHDPAVRRQRQGRSGHHHRGRPLHRRAEEDR